jgi:spore cortex formation protein SpoVR/YcgB (stage V sporulation)
MTRLHEKGMINDGAFLEFLQLHTSVVFQPDFDSKNYSGFNPYHLGFNIFADIKRMSENPTAEDLAWFPDYAGKNWVSNWQHAYENYRDDSFIQQFLSPNLIRNMRLFALFDSQDDRHYTILDVHNEQGYRNIRNYLSREYSVGHRLPDIQVTSVDFDTRVCELTHLTDDSVLLSEKDCLRTMLYFKTLWGFPVRLVTNDRASGQTIKVLCTD